MSIISDFGVAFEKNTKKKVVLVDVRKLENLPYRYIRGCTTFIYTDKLFSRIFITPFRPRKIGFWRALTRLRPISKK